MCHVGFWFSMHPFSVPEFGFAQLIPPKSNMLDVLILRSSDSIW